jgi:hypothetical protein
MIGGKVEKCFSYKGGTSGFMFSYLIYIGVHSKPWMRRNNFPLIGDCGIKFLGNETNPGGIRRDFKP